MISVLNSVYFIIISSIVTFISTNADDFFILLALFSSKQFKIKDIVIGQFLGISVLAVLASFGYFFKLFIPLSIIGVLGIIPFIIGLKEYICLITGKKITDEKFDIGYNANKYKKIFSVFSITVANGSDNIAIYAPFFAAIDAKSIAAVYIIFIIMTGLLLFLSYCLINNKTIGDKIKSIGKYIFPAVFIALGIFIFIKLKSYELFFNLK